jgi:hypothetical protein
MGSSAVSMVDRCRSCPDGVVFTEPDPADRAAVRPGPTGHCDLRSPLGLSATGTCRRRRGRWVSHGCGRAWRIPRGRSGRSDAARRRTPGRRGGGRCRTRRSPCAEDQPAVPVRRGDFQHPHRPARQHGGHSFGQVRLVLHDRAQVRRRRGDQRRVVGAVEQPAGGVAGTGTVLNQPLPATTSGDSNYPTASHRDSAPVALPRPSGHCLRRRVSDRHPRRSLHPRGATP